MLHISASQERALRRTYFRRRAGEFAAELKKFSAAPAGWRDDELLRDVLAGIDRGVDLGLESGRDILGYLMLRLRLGPDIDARTPFAELLRRPSRPEGWRIVALLGEVHGYEWLPFLARESA